MSALNVFLMVMGFGVTVLVLLAMMFLKPEHIFEPEVLTDLSDITPRHGASPAE